jgi:hypothetical protein
MMKLIKKEKEYLPEFFNWRYSWELKPQAFVSENLEEACPTDYEPTDYTFYTYLAKELEKCELFFDINKIKGKKVYLVLTWNLQTYIKENRYNVSNGACNFPLKYYYKVTPISEEIDKLASGEIHTMVFRDYLEYRLRLLDLIDNE